MSPEPFYYRFVPEDEVPGPVLWAARQARVLSEARLGLSGVVIKWCKPADKLSHEIEEIMQQIELTGAKVFGGYPSLPKREIKKDDGEFWGEIIPLVYPNTILIRADLKPEQAAKIVAHECKHLKDHSRPISIPFYDREDAEKRAEQFAEETASALGMKGS